MATFLETIGVLDYFSALFAALLVFAIVFAILHQTRLLGENKAVQGLIAILLAILVLLNEDLINLVNFISPWFVIVFVFLILLLLTYRLFGISEGSIVNFMTHDRTVNWVLLAIGIIILLAGIFNVFGERALQAREGVNETNSEVSDGGGFTSNVFNTLFHPKMLGLILVLAIAVFAVAFLGGQGA